MHLSSHSCCHSSTRQYFHKDWLVFHVLVFLDREESEGNEPAVRINDLQDYFRHFRRPVHLATLVIVQKNRRFSAVSLDGFYFIVAQSVEK